MINLIKPFTHNAQTETLAQLINAVLEDDRKTIAIAGNHALKVGITTEQLNNIMDELEKIYELVEIERITNNNQIILLCITL